MKEKTFGGIIMELNLIPRPQNVTLLEGSVAANLPVTEKLDAGLPAEGYVLRIEDGITLTAGSAQGIVWGRQTLKQLQAQAHMSCTNRLPIQPPRMPISPQPD